jgi:hypothetical protein
MVDEFPFPITIHSRRLFGQGRCRRWSWLRKSTFATKYYTISLGNLNVENIFTGANGDNGGMEQLLLSQIIKRKSMLKKPSRLAERRRMYIRKTFDRQKSQNPPLIYTRQNKKSFSNQRFFYQFQKTAHPDIRS